jgi:hypothetical protein
MYGGSDGVTRVLSFPEERDKSNYDYQHATQMFWYGYPDPKCRVFAKTYDWRSGRLIVTDLGHQEYSVSSDMFNRVWAAAVARHNGSPRSVRDFY